ncbi:MAG: hypothetical protein ACK5LN_07065 [Propioniciclava sp.]
MTQSVSRRTLATGALWATPTVIAGVTAPRVAASTPCIGGLTTIEWNQGIVITTSPDVNGEPRVATLVPTAWPLLTIQVTAVHTGQVVGSSAAMDVQPVATATYPTVGQFYDSGLTLGWRHRRNVSDPTPNAALPGSATDNFVEFTVTFRHTVTGLPVPMENLQFAITDIDFGNAPVDTYTDPHPFNPAVNPKYDRENVTLTPLPVAAPTLGVHTLGAGTDADPWHSDYFNSTAHTAWDACNASGTCTPAEKNAYWHKIYNADNNTSSAGNVAVNYGSTPVTSFTVKGWSENARIDEENIILSSLTFTCPTLL